MTPCVEFVDTSMRDGNQSLWGATGLTTADVLGIAPVVDRVGYHAVDFTASTHMAVCVRYHREDPWERIRLVAAAMPKTPLTFLTTGTRFISWRPAADDVLELVFSSVVRNGLRRVQIAEPTNDPGRLTALAASAKRAGAEQVVAALTYSLSPVHTDDYYAARIPPLTSSASVDRIYIKDPGGLLTPERAGALAAMVVGGAGGKPVEIHSHCTTSLAPLVYLEALRAGITTLHTAVRPLANGSSQPPVETTARNLVEAGFGHDLDLDAIAETAAWFQALAKRKGLPLGVPQEYDATYYRHQVPGGMVSTMRRQLDELRRPELFEAALNEVERVRAELGYPIMVTPFSQFVAGQAVLNAIAGERYASAPDELIRYLLGQFGELAASPDPEVADHILSLPRASELRDVEPLSLAGARERFGNRISDEELLLRLTMPEEQVDAMLAAPSAPTGRAPLVELLEELNRRSIGYLRVRKGSDLVVWRRDGGRPEAR